MSGMQVVQGIDRLDRSLGRLFLVVGVFDGLHLGHQYLLGELVRDAVRLEARPAVLTFDHHPDEIITGTAPPLLCDPAERLERLEAAGVAVTIVQHFDQALRETPYDGFVRRIADRVAIAGFLMTPESAFGYERRGTPEALAALGRETGFEVTVVPPFTLDGEPVTSSAIRAAIAEGDLARAADLLGRQVSVVGHAVAPRGDQGAYLSFPVPVTLPPPGSYLADLVWPGLGASPDGTSRNEVVRIDAGGRLWVDGEMPAGPVRVVFAERSATV